MNILYIILKIIVNIFLFLFYSLVSVIVGDFLYGLILFIFDFNIPGSDDPIHIKKAILIIAGVLIFTLLLRRFFYLKVFLKVEKEKKVEKVEKVSTTQKKEKKEEELEIFVNKEIK